MEWLEKEQLLCCSCAALQYSNIYSVPHVRRVVCRAGGVAKSREAGRISSVWK